jgi:hypothetical protein
MVFKGRNEIKLKSILDLSVAPVVVAVMLFSGAFAVIGCATPETTPDTTTDEAAEEMAEETTAMAAEEERDEEFAEFLFVQHANSVTLKDGLLTLEGIGDDVLYFSDRPNRIVGRKPVEWFVEGWDEGEDSFATTPPNAVLTVKKDEELVDLTIVLTHPVLTDRTLVYTVEVLDGPQSGIGSSAALFIDTFVRKAMKREAGRAANLRGRVRGGGGGRGGRGGRAGDPNLPRDPSRGARQVRRGGAEIR